MIDRDPSRDRLIHPFTPGGIARFALLRIRGIALYLAGFGLIGSAAFFLLIQQAFLAHVSNAIDAMPPAGRIENGRLLWPLGKRIDLLGNPFLEVLALPEGIESEAPSADVQWVLFPNEMRFRSLFGHIQVPYPPRLFLQFNRTELNPAWGAWRIAIFVLTGIALFVCVVGSWLMLASVYAIPIRLLGSIRRPDLGWGEAFQVGLGVLMPGAMIASTAFFLYASRAINLSAFLSLMALHFIVGWVFILIASPVIPSAEPQKLKKKNPFGKGKANPFGKGKSK